jgi:hypothetical protein
LAFHLREHRRIPHRQQNFVPNMSLDWQESAPFLSSTQHVMDSFPLPAQIEGEGNPAFTPETDPKGETMNRTMIALLGSAALAAWPALAQTTPMVTDTDGNGTYSMEELAAAVPDLTPEVFAAVDANADGAVDPAELVAAIEAGTIKPST